VRHDASAGLFREAVPMSQNIGLASFGLDGFGYAGTNSTFAHGSARGRPGSAQVRPAETLGVLGGAQGGGKGPPPGKIYRAPS